MQKNNVRLILYLYTQLKFIFGGEEGSILWWIIMLAFFCMKMGIGIFFHVFISQIFPSIKCQGMPFVQISFLFTSFCWFWLFLLNKRNHIYMLAISPLLDVLIIFPFSLSFSLQFLLTNKLILKQSNLSKVFFIFCSCLV